MIVISMAIRYSMSRNALSSKNQKFESTPPHHLHLDYLYELSSMTSTFEHFLDVRSFFRSLSTFICSFFMLHFYHSFLILRSFYFVFLFVCSSFPLTVRSYTSETLMIITCAVENELHNAYLIYLITLCSEVFFI